MSAAFREFATERGYELPQSIEPGRRFRFSTNGKKGDLAGWGILFPDGQGGVVGDWRTGSQEIWQAKRDRAFTPEERRQLMEKIEREKQAAETIRLQEERQAAERAASIWSKAQAAPQDHAYLKAKGVQSQGVRLYRGPLAVSGMRCDGALVLPVRDASGSIQSVEFISPNGEKRFLPAARKAGGYFGIGKPEGTLCICEGFATGASIHEATGHAVAVAFDAGNLLSVAKALREKFPQVRMILCADRDESGTGQRHAEEAAKACGGYIVLPDVTEGSDFNDMIRERGAEAVKAQIEAAKPITENTAPVVEIATEHVGAEVDGWPDPESLPELPEVPAFNFDVLPGPLHAFVQDIAERMQCPPEFPAVGAVVMVGAAIGRRLGIRPKKYDNWTVVPNVWGGMVGKPGIMKSPAQSEAIKPIKIQQAKAFEEYESQKVEYEIAERASKIRAGEAEKKAREAYAKDRSSNLTAILKPDAELVEPKAMRYVVNDSTPEALCETLKDNPHGVLCERDELIGLLRSMDREGNQEARALYLTAADGDKSFTVDRIMRGRGLHIPGLCIAIVGGIQPGVLAGYVKETQRGGSGDDGLLQRFGLLVYPDFSSKWKNVDRLPNLDAKKAINDLVERICKLTAEDAGAEQDEHSDIPFLRFDHKAQALFVEWQTDLEEKLRSGDDHPAITSHLAKYRKTVPALALINHICEGGTGAVTEQALARALLFIELLEAHARRVYSYAARPDLDAAKTILAKIRAGKLPMEFDARSIYRSCWSGLTTPEEVGAALRVMCDYGYLRERTDNETGGRAARIYKVHPRAKT